MSTPHVYHAAENARFADTQENPAKLLEDTALPASPSHREFDIVDITVRSCTV